MSAHIETSRDDLSDISEASSRDDLSDITEAFSRDDLSFWTNRDLKFRVLILGRANAGKTTILERLAGAAISEAEVRRDGEILPDQRGLHNVEDEICFPSRPGFVFHDSRGIEAGSAEELSTVQRFVENRSSTTDLRNQLHAIWYGGRLCFIQVGISYTFPRMCIPLDESRELFEGESTVFRWSKGTGAQQQSH
ncbi:hypothetical protein C8R44DRAFT_633677 [Mycena epipterygia]|nr:hypothetical protein C8R44DRAFT_633677 [Mycena epipterygia]